MGAHFLGAGQGPGAPLLLPYPGLGALWEHHTQILDFIRAMCAQEERQCQAGVNGYGSQSFWVMVGWAFSHRTLVVCGMERSWRLLYLSWPGQEVAMGLVGVCSVARVVVWVQTPDETWTKGGDTSVTQGSSCPFCSLSSPAHRQTVTLPKGRYSPVSTAPVPRAVLGNGATQATMG